MPLTHVCMWSEHGWKRITASEASYLHPGGTVSARSGLFMCELCGQFVTLTDGYVRDRYFKHSAEELSKDCPERTFSTAFISSFQAGTHDLPLRLRILSPKEFELQLGLLPVPTSLIANRKGQKVIISLSDRDDKRYSYSFERILEGTITYLSIGNIPCNQYQITVSPENKDLVSYWPKRVEGISRKGVLFDAATCKKLPNDADTVINHEYYLLTKQHFFSNPPGITAKLICHSSTLGNVWYIYIIVATSFEESTAKFFLGYHCRLTENAVELIPLWPVYVETPYRLIHRFNKMHFFLKGDATPKVFPSAFMESVLVKGDAGKYFCLNCKERQQILSAGRTKVLRYTYLWQDDLKNQATLPQVVVTDTNETMVSCGNQVVLPKNQTIIVKAPFDGWVLRKKDGVIIERYILSAQQQTEIDSIRSGEDIVILQGLDLVWNTHFSAKHVKTDYNADDELYNRLIKCSGDRMSLPHSMGALALKMTDYPKSKDWFYSCIKQGSIPRNAYLILCHHFTRR